MPIVSRLFVLSVLILASCYVSGAEFKQLEFQATSTAFTEDCRYLMADNKESISNTGSSKEDVDTRIVPINGGRIKSKSVFDKKGRLLEMSFLDADDKQCIGEHCFAKLANKYDEHGNCIETAFFGLDGKLCLNKSGYARVTQKCDDKGNNIEVAYFDVDGKPCLGEDGYAKLMNRHDERGNMIESFCFGIDGSPCLHKLGFAKMANKYDEMGNMTESASFGVDGKPCNIDGYAKLVTRYDERGNLLEMAYFGVDGKLCNIDGYAKLTSKYDERGNNIETAYFGADGKPCFSRYGYAKKILMPNESGIVQEMILYDENGQLIAKDNYEFNDFNEVVKIKRTTEDGHVNCLYFLIVVSEVFEKSPAQSAGVLIGDIILQINDWRCELGSSVEARIRRIDSLVDQGKKVVICRMDEVNSRPSPKIISLDLPNGIKGIQIDRKEVSEDGWKAINEKYIEFTSGQK